MRILSKNFHIVVGILVICFAIPVSTTDLTRYYSEKGEYSFWASNRWQNIPAVAQRTKMDFTFLHSEIDSITTYPFFYVECDLKPTDSHTPELDMLDTALSVKDLADRIGMGKEVKSGQRFSSNYDQEKRLYTTSVRLEFYLKDSISEYQHIANFYGKDRTISFILCCNADVIEPYLSEFKDIIESFKFDPEVDYLPEPGENTKSLTIVFIAVIVFLSILLLIILSILILKR